MSSHFLSAFTAANAAYPAFVNLSAVQDDRENITDLVVTVRRASDHPNISFHPVEVAVPRDEAVDMLKTALLDMMTPEEMLRLRAELCLKELNVRAGL